MRIGIIDADLMDNGTRHPNLALMKIAGFYRDNGNEVKLIFNSYKEIKEYDKVFISKVFNFTNVPEWVLKEKNVCIGGTGFFEDGGKSLPDEIEHHKPYYDLYLYYIDEMIKNGKKRKYYEDYLDYSIGFTTRGCFRKCSFCVNKKYDRVQRHSHVDEFLDESRPKIYLWDDNILAFPQWEEVLDELESTGKSFQFRQGIDLRLMNDRIAYRFNNTKWNGDFIFAFDHLEDKKVICSNIQLWKKYTNKQPKLYVLSGYDSQDQKDIANVFERIRLLMKYGCLPYIMRYEKYKESKYKGMYIQIARWCNQPQFYKKMSFKEFCERNQYYHPNPNTYCSAYKAMVDFEIENPDIAKKYFDLKYINENIYIVNYGFGQKYCNKPECKKCKYSWNDILNQKFELKDVLQLYLTKEINIRCLLYSNSECINKSRNVANFVLDLLLKSTENECIQCLSTYKEKIHTKESEKIILDLETDYIDFLNGNLLNKKFTLTELFDVYGITKEREKRKLKDKIKILSICDLLYYSTNNKKGIIELTELGKVFMNLKRKEKEKVFKILKYRLPIIQDKFVQK